MQCSHIDCETKWFLLLSTSLNWLFASWTPSLMISSNNALPIPYLGLASCNDFTALLILTDGFLLLLIISIGLIVRSSKRFDLSSLNWYSQYCWYFFRRWHSQAHILNYVFRHLITWLSWMDPTSIYDGWIVFYARNHFYFMYDNKLLRLIDLDREIILTEMLSDWLSAVCVKHS